MYKQNFSLGSILFLLLVVEITTRVMDGDYAFKNRLQQAETLFQAAYPVQYDSDLGWIPKPGTSGKTNIWGTIVTILDDGIRSNGSPSSLLQDDADHLILAVGDSFTLGDQVSDHETWPAILEELLGKRVLNAGVFGYGVDQIFLRAQQLIAKYHPQALIFSFIPGDIYRCELSEQMGAGKPYFETARAVGAQEYSRAAASVLYGEHNPASLELQLFYSQNNAEINSSF